MHIFAGDLAGCGLELSTVQNGKDLQQYSFGFDKVFCPSATQVGDSKHSTTLTKLGFLQGASMLAYSAKWMPLHLIHTP